MRPITSFAICLLFLLQSCQNEKTNVVAITPAVAEHFTYVNSPTEFAEANQLKQAKKYRSAAKAYQDLLQTNLPLSDEEKANTWNQLIYCMITSGGQMREVAVQLEAFEDALSIADLGGGIRADYLYNKAFQLMHVGEGRPAIGMLEEALEIYEEVYSGAHLRKVETNVLLSEALYYYSPKPNILEATFHYLDEAAEQVVGDSLLVGYAHRYFYWDGFVGFMRRGHEGGIASVNIAMNLVNENMEIEDTLLLGNCLTTKGILLRSMGKGSEAEIALLNAIDLGEQGEIDWHLEMCYKNLIFFYIRQKDSLNFSIWMEKVNQKFRNPQFIQPLRLKANWYFHQGNYTKATSCFRELVQVLDENTDLINRPKLYDEAYYQLGELYRLNSQIDSSIYFISRSMALGTYLYGKEEISWDDMLSKTLKEKSIHSFIDYGKLADTYFLKFKRKSRNIEDLNKAAELYFITDFLMFNYSMMADDNASLVFLSEVATKYYPNAVQVFYELFKETKKIDYVDKANFFIERQKSFLRYRDMFSDEKGSLINSTIAKKEKKIREEIKKQKWLLGNRDNKSKEASMKIHKGLQGIVDIYRAYKKDHPLIFEEKMQHKIQPLSEIQDFMEEDKVILQYAIASDKIHVIVIEKDNIDFLQWNKSVSFDTTYKSFKKLLKSKDAAFSKKDFQSFVRISHELYNCLVAPANISSRDVLVVSDSAYPTIPFGALIKSPVAENNKLNYTSLDYLIRDWIISYTPSLKNYKEKQQAKTKSNGPSKIIAFAYSDRSDSNKGSSIFRAATLTELSGAAREVKYIQELFGNKNGVFYYGQDSNRDNFFMEIEKEYDLLHLALHSEADLDDPLNNRLYFRDPNTKKSAKPVYSFEISALDLKMPLVVLSSCSSGDGIVYKSEGTHSLTRAFMEAGAEEVVSALWDVSDAMTSEVMEDFYSEVKKGEEVDVALRKAKIEYLKEADQYQGFPGYWSGVICWE